MTALRHVKQKPQRALIIQTARTWKGTPYHHQGRVKGVGVDCIGLLLGVAREIGMNDFDRVEFRRYQRHPPRGRDMLVYFDEVCGKRLEVAEPADIMVFWMSEQSRKAQHVALRTDYGIIHTHSDVGRVVETTYAPYWQERFLCAYRAPGVEE